MHHGVGLVTGTITLRAYRCGNGTRSGVLTQIGVVSGCNLMENTIEGFRKFLDEIVGGDMLVGRHCQVVGIR